MADRGKRPAEVTPVRLAFVLALLVIGVPLLVVTTRPGQIDVTRAAHNAASELDGSGASRYLTHADVQAALVRSNPGMARSGSIAFDLDLRDAGSTASESRFEISRDDGAHPVCLVASGSWFPTASGTPEATFSVREGPC